MKCEVGCDADLGDLGDGFRVCVDVVDDWMCAWELLV